jgi:hypothetical protein
MIGGALLAAAALAAQAPGDSDVRPWTPAGISSDRFESHAAFDPRTGDLYFVRSARDFSGWRILMSTCGAHGWTTPVPPPSPDGLEADPFFSADGRTQTHLDARHRRGRSRGSHLAGDRDAAGTWAVPQPRARQLPPPPSGSGPSSDGWRYFGSGRDGGGASARPTSGARGTERPLAGPGISVRRSTRRVEKSKPMPPSPDGARLIVAAADGFIAGARRAGTAGRRASASAGDQRQRHRDRALVLGERPLAAVRARHRRAAARRAVTCGAGPRRETTGAVVSAAALTVG